MNTLADNYKNDHAVTPQQFVDLAGKVGLSKVFQRYMNYTAEILEKLLRQYGLFW